MKGRCCPIVILIISLLVCSIADGGLSHKLVKRQVPPRAGAERAIPLSRSRQFPPPEELEESEYENSEDEDPKAPVSLFRGRQPAPADDDYSDEQTYTEAPKITTPAPQRIPARAVVFNNRFNARPKFGAQFSTTSTSTTAAPKTSTASNTNPRFRSTPAQSQRLDVVANILNKPPPSRSTARSAATSRAPQENSTPKPTPNVPSVNDQASRRSGGNTRFRPRGRVRAKSTTTTTTTTTLPPSEEYYYYYDDEEETPKNPPIATTTSTTTTTTTTTPRPAPPKRPTYTNRRTSNSRSSKSTPRPVRFDIESQFKPPPDVALDVVAVTSESPKKFTTSTTTEPPGGYGDIPVHLRHKYRPRHDGRFIDFLRDPNRPRELKGFDLTDYPFYIRVPEDIDFECDDKKDGYYASIPHHCQLFHYCFASARYDFLCANYTLYDQTTFTCRFANNVDCPSSAKYFYRNDDLWKETTTTTVAPQTTTKKRKSRPRDYDYDEEEYDYEEDEDEDDAPGRRRRPPPRRRNRRKHNKRKQTEEPEE